MKTRVEWYREAFAADYLWLYSHRSEQEATAQVRTAVRLLPFKPGQKLLDIACGAGRHMLAFTRRGAGVTGIDLSQTLVTYARRRFKEEGLKGTVIKSDMRELDYREKFDGATIWFTSIGYFATVAEDQRVITGMAAALKPGGWWWVDLPNPAKLEESLVPHSEKTRRGPNGMARVIEDRRIIGPRVEKTIKIIDRSGTRQYRESVRMYRPEQFGVLIRKAGLAADGILGDYNGVALTKDSPRQIWYGRKRRA
jgi:ubiquinone/menaquinone biosynthesis C-methylase UbiE